MKSRANLLKGHQSRWTRSRPLQIQPMKLRRKRTMMTMTSPQHHPSLSFEAVQNGGLGLRLSYGPLPRRTLQTHIPGNQNHCRSILNSLQSMNSFDAWPWLSILRFHLRQEPLLLSGGDRSPRPLQRRRTCLKRSSRLLVSSERS